MGSCISSFPHNPSSSKLPMDNATNTINSINSIPPPPIKDKPITVDPPIISSLSHKSKVSPLNSVSSYRSHGSRDEMFYDTQGWLESDCEDDFYSVNGDFTPSRGNTPVHHAVGTPRFNKTFSPQVNRALFEGRPSLHSASNLSRGSTSVRRSISSTRFTGSFSEEIGTNPITSSTTRKKKLLDLFRESVRERGGEGLAFAGYESETIKKMETSPTHSPSIHGLPPKPPKGSSPLSRAKSLSTSDKKTSAYGHVYDTEKSLKFGHRCFPKLVSIRSLHENKKTTSPVTSFKSQKSNRSLGSTV